MTSLTRPATTVWDGNLGHGAERLSGASGAVGGLPGTHQLRIGRPDGRTSPEELAVSATLSQHD
jgi:hypothetical protein